MATLTLAACLLISAATAELSGRVVDESEQPIAGAIVVIRTGRPRVGPAMTCPSCYRDCTKRTLTDDRGRFKISGLSDTLLFTLAAGATNFQGTASDFYDPADAKDITLTLKPLPAPTDSSIGRVRGQVVDQDNQPLAGAEIRSRTIHRDSGLVGGSDESVTELTLADESGQFEISVGKHISAIDLRATANGFAPNDVRWTRESETPLKIQLGVGASLRGTLTFNGQPLPLVKVGLVQKNRIVGNIVTPQEIHTDRSGVFHFENLPPEMEYTLYTHNGQDAPGVLPVSIVDAPKHGERAELGSIPTVVPSSLTIRVKTEDGSKLPQDSYVMLLRRDAWRGAKSVLPRHSETQVSFNDVAKETFNVILRVPGYSVAKTTPPTNIDMNRYYTLPIRGDTELEFVVRPNQADGLQEPNKQSL